MPVARPGFGGASGRSFWRPLAFGNPESYNVFTYLRGVLLVNGKRGIAFIFKHYN